ncbi:MAG: PH domain-containing protein [bacterium]
MQNSKRDPQTHAGNGILLQGSFDPKLKTYLLLQYIFLLFFTLFGLVLIPLIMWLINKHYNALSCEMTEKFLKVRKGVLVKIEKNVPLEQITDLGIVEGPLMRFLGIKQLSVETAGQSSTGPLVKLLGVVDAESFRDQVLQQRDKLRKTVQTDAPEGAPVADNTQLQILATLERIEQLLDKRS